MSNEEVHQNTIVHYLDENRKEKIAIGASKRMAKVTQTAYQIIETMTIMQTEEEEQQTIAMTQQKLIHALLNTLAEEDIYSFMPN